MNTLDEIDWQLIAELAQQAPFISGSCEELCDNPDSGDSRDEMPLDGWTDWRA